MSGPASAPKVKRVVAGILVRGGEVLCCQRPASDPFPLKWEFPGGKVEPGETPEQALARELEEELAISQASGREITRYSYTYPGKNPIELIFYRITAYGGEPQNLVFHEMRWEPASRLGIYD